MNNIERLPNLIRQAALRLVDLNYQTIAKETRLDLVDEALLRTMFAQRSIQPLLVALDLESKSDDYAELEAVFRERVQNIFQEPFNAVAKIKRNQL